MRLALRFGNRFAINSRCCAIPVIPILSKAGFKTSCVQRNGSVMPGVLPDMAPGVRLTRPPNVLSLALRFAPGRVAKYRLKLERARGRRNRIREIALH